MQLTYREALDTIIDLTETGYTIESQDRLWIVFIFDIWSEDQMRYNRLYQRGIGNAMAYDRDMEGVLVWTTRAEAEHYAEQLREWLAEPNPNRPLDVETPEVYVMNLGDDARLEASYIGRDSGAVVRETPKFKGSERAWEAYREMSRKWVEEVSPKFLDSLHDLSNTPE